MKDDNWERLCFAATDYYSFNAEGRQYHNYGHAIGVLRNVCALHKNRGTTPDTLLLAAIWHDAIYIPGARDGLNEEASAAALDYEWKRLSIDEPAHTLNDAKWLIENTRVSNHLDSEEQVPFDLAILLDADLASLADSYVVFVQTQANIFAENSGDPNNAGHVKRQKDFLSKFLTVRKNIYHTQIARDNLEASARENIERFIKG